MSNQDTGKQDVKPDEIPPAPNKYPGHYPDPAWLASKILEVIKKVLERRRASVFTKD